MLVIDVVGILSFVFWAIVVCGVLTLIGYLIGGIGEGVGEKIQEWKKDGGPIYAAIMILVFLAIGVAYILVLLSKASGQSNPIPDELAYFILIGLFLVGLVIAIRYMYWKK